MLTPEELGRKECKLLRPVPEQTTPSWEVYMASAKSRFTQPPTDSPAHDNPASWRAPTPPVVIGEPKGTPYHAGRFGCMAGTMTIHGDLSSTGERWEAEG